jgi:transcriptional regulator with XRE-family HTH domain
VPRKPVPDLALAAVLRRLRTERGESQEAVAYRSGLSSGSYARIELAQSAPGWDTVCSIADALGVSMAKLGAAVEAERRKSAQP